MGIVPSFFNINEPILFGAPIIMNPMMFIPFVCVPMVNAVLAYGATRLGWLSGGVADAVDYAGPNWRVVGG